MTNGLPDRFVFCLLCPVFCAPGIYFQGSSSSPFPISISRREGQFRWPQRTEDMTQVGWLDCGIAKSVTGLVSRFPSRTFRRGNFDGRVAFWTDGRPHLYFSGPLNQNTIRIFELVFLCLRPPLKLPVIGFFLPHRQRHASQSSSHLFLVSLIHLGLLFLAHKMFSLLLSPPRFPLPLVYCLGGRKIPRAAIKILLVFELNFDQRWRLRNIKDLGNWCERPCGCNRSQKAGLGEKRLRNKVCVFVPSYLEAVKLEARLVFDAV